MKSYASGLQELGHQTQNDDGDNDEDDDNDRDNKCKDNCFNRNKYNMHWRKKIQTT